MSWITDRVPTRDDADEDGDVIVPAGPRSIGYRNYEAVALGQSWWSPFGKESPAAVVGPEPRKVVQIAISNEPDRPTAIYALCNDGNIFVDYPVVSDHDWRRLPPIPQP